MNVKIDLSYLLEFPGPPNQAQMVVSVIGCHGGLVRSHGAEDRDGRAYHRRGLYPVKPPSIWLHRLPSTEGGTTVVQLSLVQAPSLGLIIGSLSCDVPAGSLRSRSSSPVSIGVRDRPSRCSPLIRWSLTSPLPLLCGNAIGSDYHRLSSHESGGSSLWRPGSGFRSPAPGVPS